MGLAVGKGDDHYIIVAYGPFYCDGFIGVMAWINHALNPMAVR